LTGKNIDGFDEFLSIPQHFTHQNFPLIIFCHLPACLPDNFFMQGIIAVLRTNAILFPVHN